MTEQTSMYIKELFRSSGSFRFYRGRQGLFEFADDVCHKFDDETWFSITPLEVAKSHAHSISRDSNNLIVLDAFCGVGGDIVQHPSSVFAIGCDINRDRLETAIQLTSRYGPKSRCDFVLADSIRGIRPCFRRNCFDAVYLSPPWGHVGVRPRHIQPIFGSRKLSSLSVDGFSTFLRALLLTKNASIALYLPRGMKEDELVLLAETAGDRDAVFITVHESFDPDDETDASKSKYKVRAITAYFGSLARR